MSAGKPTPLGGARPMAAGNALSIPYSSADGYVHQYTPGTYTFTAPRAGYHKFVLWGPAGASCVGTLAVPGGSGAYVEYSRFMGAGETVSVVVGLSGSNTTLTFANGKVVTAGTGGDNSGGTPGTGGVASGGDVNLNGTAGNAGSGAGSGGGFAAPGSQNGAGAPAVLPFRGGYGGGTNALGGAPGGSHSGGYGGAVATVLGSDGLAIILFVRP